METQERRMTTTRNHVRIFISYSHKDRAVAGKIKRELECYNMKVFLAHEDIEPSAKWVERILSELKSADVFLPIISDNFRNSLWTDQEAGIAIARGMLIIPIRTTQNPYGFLSRYQALSLQNDAAYTCFDIMKSIASHRKFGIKLKNLIVKRFISSQSYMETSKNFDFLFSFNRFTSHQATQIVKYAMSNDQIYGYYGAKSRIARFLRENKNKINTVLTNECKKFFKIK